MTDHIRTDIKDRILTITIARPDRKNALTQAMYGKMADAIAAANDDKAVRAIVMTGEGDMFTAGNDLTDFASMDERENGEPPVTRFLNTIRDAQKPIIVAVNGPAIGVGLTLLLHADITYASDTANFRAPFTALGWCRRLAPRCSCRRRSATQWQTRSCSQAASCQPKRRLPAALSRASCPQLNCSGRPWPAPQKSPPADQRQSASPRPSSAAIATLSPLAWPLKAAFSLGSSSPRSLPKRRPPSCRNGHLFSRTEANLIIAAGELGRALVPPVLKPPGWSG